MDAFLGRINRATTTLACVVGMACAAFATADETKHAIRLPDWVEAANDPEVQTASYRVAPLPKPRFEADPPEPIEPRPFPNRLPETDSAHPVRQLEHAAGEATGEHALSRVIERYHSTRRRLSKGDTPHLAARTDRAGSWAFHARGRERAERGDPRGALADFREAVRVDPGNLAALHDLGIALAERRENEEAIAAFDSVLRRSPDSTEALRNRATLRLRTGEAELAVNDCDRALKRLVAGTPDHTSTLTLRGSALHAAGRLRESSRDLDEALRQRPHDARTRVAHGHVFADAGFYEQALSDYAAALQSDPSSVEAYRSLAWILATCPEARLRDPETAIEAAWRARRLLGRDDRLTLDASAAAHAAAGEFEEAIRLQQRLLMQFEGIDNDAFKTARRRLNAYKAGQPYVAQRVATTR